MEPLFKSLANLKDEEPKYTSINFSFTKVEYGFEHVLQMLNNPNIPDIEIIKQINYRLNEYMDLDNIKNPELHSSLLEIWKNMRFLRIVSEIVTEKDTSIIIILYDMLSIVDLDDDHRKVIYQIIYKVLYRKYILPLSSITDKDNARTISLMRFSSYDNKTCIERVNKCITMLYDLKVNDIVYIYSIFFFNQFSNLFNYTMADTEGYESLNASGKEVYNKISAAICYILENMPMHDIDRVLRRWINYSELLGINSIIRFSIKDLSDVDFPRIIKVVNELHLQGYTI